MYKTGFGQESGLLFNAAVTVDNINNFGGGIKQGSSFLGLLNLQLAYKPNKSIFRNTDFFVSVIKTAGKPASENFIGDAQVASNIEGYAPLFFYELWAKQNFDSFSLLAGLHDLNSVFFVSDHSSLFINSSFGISPGLTLNMPLSIFPSVTFGMVAGYEKQKVSFFSGLYNVNHAFPEEENFHLHNHNFGDGFFNINELQYRPNKNSQLKIGAYYKICNDTVTFSGKKNYGIYLVADKTFYTSATEDKSVNGFLQLNSNLVKNNPASEYIGAGLLLKGFLLKKYKDVFGFGLAAVKLNRLNEYDQYEKGSFETAIELNYQITLFEMLTVQPDIQYIINPGGVYHNAFTGILRLQFSIN